MVELKGVGRNIELMSLEWRDHKRFPTSVLIRETGLQIILPPQDIVSFGRLEIIEGMNANDVVLSLPDPIAARQISRWHFELRRRPSGYVLRAMSNQPTTVDGVPVEHGEDVPIVLSRASQPSSTHHRHRLHCHAVAGVALRAVPTQRCRC